MAETDLGTGLAEIGARLSSASRSYRPGVRIREEGFVTAVADGVVRIAGLPGVGVEEVVDIGSHATGLVLSLERDCVRAVALGEHHGISEGDDVRATGRSAAVPVGEALLGRIVDPLGRPLDGEPLRGRVVRAPLERRAPQIHERADVHRPLLTGVLAIDAMFPIGRGQRELILGEEGSGKTSLVLDVLLRQAASDVVCVYVAVGPRRADVWQAAEALRRGGGSFIVVAAPEDASPGMRYLAPYAGTAMAEHFADRGEHAVVVYDDLSAHAVAWRELSLLLRRPPGREAYPGDVFHLHSRLLERAAQLSVERGGGSLTALPVAVLEGGRLASYIPTNLISITDGQIVLSQELFSAGQKPAVDAGVSVSRVGGKAQPQALRELAGRMRLDYAAFLEVESFSRIGTRLEPGTLRRIEAGRRVRRLLKARRLAPLPLFAEVVRLVLAAEVDALLEIPETAVEDLAAELTTASASALPGLVARFETDMVLAEHERRSIAEIVRRHVAGRFGGPGGARG